MEEIKKENKKLKQNAGITLLSIALALLLLSVFSIIPGVKAFLLGSFGFMLYPLLVVAIFFGVALIMDMKFVYSPKYLVYLGLCLFFFECIIHIIFTGFNGAEQMTYGEYLSSVYMQRFTPGGVIVGIFTFPLISLLHALAGIVIYSIALVISIYFVASYLQSVKQGKVKSVKKDRYKDFEEMASEVQFDKLFEEQEREKQELKSVTTPPPSHKIAENSESIFIEDTKDNPSEVDIAKEKLGLNTSTFEEQKEATKEDAKKDYLIKKKTTSGSCVQ